jgi:LmbE family N-acetylglucosaminyl deacetylase
MRLLLTVAHPDDESFGCGSLLAHATAGDIETVVLCATRGDAGECPPEIAPEALGAVRAPELRDAARILGVARVELLDYGDSGLTGPVERGMLVAAPIDVSERRGAGIPRSSERGPSGPARRAESGQALSEHNTAPHAPI